MEIEVIAGRQSMQPSLRIALRVARRRAIFSGDWAEARVIGRAIRDRDIQDEILERLIDANVMSDLAIGDGSLLKWLIENWELIFKIIVDIIGLFPESKD